MQLGELARSALCGTSGRQPRRKVPFGVQCGRVTSLKPKLRTKVTNHGRCPTPNTFPTFWSQVGNKAIFFSARVLGSIRINPAVRQQASNKRWSDGCWGLWFAGEERIKRIKLGLGWQLNPERATFHSCIKPASVLGSLLHPPPPAVAWYCLLPPLLQLHVPTKAQEEASGSPIALLCFKTPKYTP